MEELTPSERRGRKESVQGLLSGSRSSMECVDRMGKGQQVLLVVL